MSKILDEKTSRVELCLLQYFAVPLAGADFGENFPHHLRLDFLADQRKHTPSHVAEVFPMSPLICSNCCCCCVDNFLTSILLLFAESGRCLFLGGGDWRETIEVSDEDGSGNNWRGCGVKGNDAEARGISAEILVGDVEGVDKSDNFGA